MTNVFKFTSSVFVFVLSLGLSTLTSTSVFGQATDSTAKAPAKAPAKAAVKATNKTTKTAKPASSKPLPYNFQDLEKGDDMDKIRTQIPNIIKTGTFKDATEKEQFQDFFQTFFFARWINNGKTYQVEMYRKDSVVPAPTKTTGKNATPKAPEDPIDNWTYPVFIEEFRNMLNRSQSDGEPQQELVKIAYKFATDVIESDNVNCTNAAKFNCMLLLGNMYYKVTQSSSTPPKAVALALKYLLTTIGDANAPCYLRIGALQGLSLMLDKATLDDKQKKAVYEVLFPILNTKVDVTKYTNSKEDPTGAGALWLRERTIVAMGLLAGANQNESATGFYPPKDIIKAVYSIITDDSAPMTTRTVAVESLGSYNFSKYPELKAKLPPHLLKAVASFVVDGIQAELDRQSDPLIWGDNVNEFSHGAHEDDSSIPHDDTSDAAFMFQRTLPYLFATRVAMNGINPSKGWEGLSGFGSDNDKAIAKKIIQQVRSINTVEKTLKSASQTEDTLETDEETSAPSKVQDLVSALTEIQGVFKKYAE